MRPPLRAKCHTKKESQVTLFMQADGGFCSAQKMTPPLRVEGCIEERESQNYDVLQGRLNKRFCAWRPPGRPRK
jgi:hypothetical protein